MQDKLNDINSRQDALNISYTMDELVRGQDYWVNKLLGRPIKGLGSKDIPVKYQGKEQMSYETEKVLSTLTMSDLDELRPHVIDAKSYQLVNLISSLPLVR